MYYRRKILLSLLEVFGGELKKIKLQKLLMLYSKIQQEQSYHFVPYKYGCFSFLANADLHTMIKYDQVDKKDKKWIRIESKSWLNELRESDRRALFELKERFGDKSVKEIIKITYKKYPYYAINSTILEEVLSKEEQKKVFKFKEKEYLESCLFTIGYEGISFEQYLNTLIRNRISALVDVRKNAMSMKYGFNKSQLKNACVGVGIQYFHHSEVGIKSSKRKELKTQADYNRLFAEYKQTVLPHTFDTQNKIVDLIKEHKRVALTCFEAESCQCHRRPLAEYLIKCHELSFGLIHL